MKRIFTLLILFFLGFPTVVHACEVCQKNQPKVLRNITHGTGPQGNIDYIIIWSAIIIVALTLFFSLKYLIRPKGNASDHIKNSIIE